MTIVIQSWHGAKRSFFKKVGNLGCHSSGGMPAQQVESPEFKPSTTNKQIPEQVQTPTTDWSREC
jgi:hypothetical protein